MQNRRDEECQYNFNDSLQELSTKLPEYFKTTVKHVISTGLKQLE